MAETTIEWAHYTFNPVWGCQKVSPGCAHCYAEAWATRYGHDVFGPVATTPRRVFGEKHWNEPRRWNRVAEQFGERRRVFCASMADVFEDHPTTTAAVSTLWDLIRATPALDWLLLTKRPGRIAQSLPADWGTGWPHVWLGTSVESQDYVGRAETLVTVPAAVRFLSCEPLLGPLELGVVAKDLDWVIVGGESGAGARPMAPEWSRALRDECAAAGVAFFLKQLGGHPKKRGGYDAVLDGRRHTDVPASQGVLS